MCVLASCADPGSMPSSESETAPSAVDGEDQGEPAPRDPAQADLASAAPAPAELAADELEAFASPDDAIAAYRGPRVGVTPDVERVQAGVPFHLTASITDADGVAVPVDDSMRFTWRLPDGWQLEGEGAVVTVTPDALPDGTDPIDVGVAIDRDGARLVRGGVMLAR